MTQFTLNQVRSYYERNTPAFVAFGQGGAAGAIHRAVWGAGVSTADEAFRYVEDRIAARIGRMRHLTAEPHVVDLGCGVGASLCYLAEQLPGITATGITLSPLQAQLARERIAGRGLSSRVACLEGDYNNLPERVRPADVAYAIESFVHGPDPARFFAQCYGLLRPGGVLVVCDDFRRPTPDPAAPAVIERFRRGWHVNTLVEAAELHALAAAAGFSHESTEDLSSYLELGRPRDLAIGVFAAAAGWMNAAWDRFGPLLGGSALQRCLKRGWIGYDLVTFIRLE
jgi:tocopherol O-methyltransferase